MVVISDTTTISNLFLIKRLSLLEKLYYRISIPRAVFEELEKLELSGWNINDIKYAGWIEVVDVKNRDMVTVLSEILDVGEAEAITLAKEKEADLLIIDEIKGRNYAKKLDIKIIGLIGILLQAKQEKIIDNLENVLIELRENAGFWIKNDLFDKALLLAGER
jgi:predicted nucleic acid-binding protein